MLLATSQVVTCLSVVVHFVHLVTLLDIVHFDRGVLGLSVLVEVLDGRRVSLLLATPRDGGILLLRMILGVLLSAGVTSE